MSNLYMGPICTVALNPAVGIGLTIAGVGVAFIPVAGQLAAAAKKATMQGARIAVTSIVKAKIRNVVQNMAFRKVAGAVLQIGARLVVPLLLNIVIQRFVRTLRGEVCAFLVGQTMMDCAVVGAGAKHSEVAAQNGNLALSPGHWERAQEEFDAYVAMIAEEERRARSPFDITSPHTFLGSMVSGILPHAMTFSSVLNISSVVSSMTRSATVALLPTTSAFRLADLSNSREACEEPELYGVATDPFCNPIYAIPAGWLTHDMTEPDKVLDYFVDRGLVTVNTDENSAQFGDITIVPHNQAPGGINALLNF